MLSVNINGQVVYIKEEVKSRIDAMSRVDIARAIRYGSSSDGLFIGDNYKYLMARYEELGKISPEISKQIGWEV